MSVNLGINGAGRIGRCVIRAVLKRRMSGDESVNIVAVNDPFVEIKSFAYLLKYDSVHGRIDAEVEVSDNCVKLGKYMTIKISTEKDPAQIKWTDLGVECVIEATGVFLKVEQASLHLKGGAKKVIISAPSPDAPTFVYGVNDDKYEPSMNVVSNASCTTNCLAPIAKVIHDNFGIDSGLMTTVHATTATQKTVDGYSAKSWRDGRSALCNIIPAATGAARAVGKVIPELNGILTGMAMRVPVANVSVVDLSFVTKKETTYDEIIAKLREASTGRLKGILQVTEDNVVSTDFNSTSFSSSVDKNSGLSIGSKMFKIISWYDNEMAYSTRLVDLAKHIKSKS